MLLLTQAIIAIDDEIHRTGEQGFKVLLATIFFWPSGQKGYLFILIKVGLICVAPLEGIK